MPTENERKYVLCLECEDVIKEAAESVLVCNQAYLVYGNGMSARVRETIDKDGKSRYKFCFKMKVRSGRVVEIEEKINRRDFDELWLESLIQLKKLRYNVWVNEERFDENHDLFPLVLWEVDFFKTRGETYFALAEHEMPEGQLEPNMIPEIIQENLVFTPDANNSDFSSKKLANVEYAVQKYQELTRCCD